MTTNLAVITLDHPRRQADTCHLADLVYLVTGDLAVLGAA